MQWIKAGRGEAAALVITLGAVLAAAGCASGTASAATSKASASAQPAVAAGPTLGHVWGPGGQQGYGTVRPATVYNGGDPTGLVQDVAWTSWGGPNATGTGIARYVTPGQSVAQSTAQRAIIVAFDLGTCGGHPAYRAVEWFFPQHGGAFSTATYLNDCTGTYVGN